MSKVTVEIELPESCVQCPLGNNKSIPLGTFIICNLTKRGFIGDGAETKRPGWCPLDKQENRTERKIPEKVKRKLLEKFTEVK